MDSMQETIETYNNFAEDYKKRYKDDGDSNKMQPSLDKFLSLLRTGRKILDIGSGTGFDAKYFSELDYEVTGIDLAEKLLAVAKEIAPKVNFEKMDMRAMTFTNDTFDGVWASASLLHLPKNEAKLVIKNIARILKIGGVFYLGLKKGEGEEFKINSGQGNLDGARRFFSYYSKDEVEKNLANSGFDLVDYTEDTNRENTWMSFFLVKKK